MDNTENNFTVQTAPPQFQYPAPQYLLKPKKYATGRGDYFMAIMAVLCGIFSVLWGIYIKTGWTIVYDIYLISGCIYLGKKSAKPRFYPVICGTLSLAVSAVFCITDNELVKFFAFVIMLALGIVCLSGFAGKNVDSSDFSLISHIFRYPFNALGDLPKTVRSFFSGESAKKKKVTGALLGVVCAIPLLCVVIPLLISSDAAFEGMLTGVIDSLGEALIKIPLIIIITPLLISFLFSLKKREEANTNKPQPKGADTVFLAAFTGVLCLCYLVYLFSQLAYFFSAFSGFLPENYEFSYAEYARRGFFELCAISAINLVVMFLVTAFSKKKNGKMPAILCVTDIFTGVFTLLIICTAISKMVMYISNYGMTLLRIGTSAFMVFMAVVFIAMILKCRISKINVLKAALVTAGVIITVLGVGNINRFAAKYNYDAFVSGKLKTVDVEYLGRIGKEGVPYLVKLAQSDNKDIKKQAEKALAQAVYESYYIEQTEIYDNGLTSADYEKYGDEAFENAEITEIKTELGDKMNNAFYELSKADIDAYKAYDSFFEKHPHFVENSDNLLMDVH